MKRLLALAAVVLLVWGYHSWKESLGWFGRILPGNYTCAEPSFDPPVVASTRFATAAGDLVHAAATSPAPSTETIREHVQGALGVVGTWLGAFRAAANGAEPPDEAVAYGARAEAVGAALAACGQCPTTVTPVGLTGPALARAAATAAGFTGSDLDVAVAVAGAESSYVPTATHVNSNGSTDYGLWQINSIHRDLLAAGLWSDPYANARMARAVFTQAGGWSPWSVYRSGAYRAYLPGTTTVLPVSLTEPAACVPSPGAEPAVYRPGASVQTTSVRGIVVNVAIASQLEQLLGAADAAGLRLSGSGYRSQAAQIALREAHCPDVWHAPPSSCTPPTAIPGTSRHEQGLAVDFTSDGHLIRSHDDPAWLWLTGHAGFLRNLPSEPWHWSVDGR